MRRCVFKLQRSAKTKPRAHPWVVAEGTIQAPTGRDRRRGGYHTPSGLDGGMPDNPGAKLNRSFGAEDTRSGFTILEMVLALAIAVVLLWGLYNALNMQVQQAHVGRTALQEATLARSILTRMAADIQSNLGPVNQFLLSNSGTGSSSSTTTTPTTDNTFSFNNGVYGQSNVLVLVVSKAPRELNLVGANPSDPTQQATVSDLRRISYWIVPGDDQNSGLVRQDIPQATSNEIMNVPPTVTDTSTYQVLAPEVKDITLQYFDGLDWQDTWDGTVLGGPNQDTPIGPPAAIRITLTFQRKAPDGSDLPDSSLPSYQHVVAIPAGNNFPQTNTGS
jgi:prepilin-type N-terminal cleavage/methylation domain-containing protein